MRLAENTLFLRLLSREDLARSGALGAFLDHLDARFAPSWDSVRDAVEVRGPWRDGPERSRDAFVDVLEVGMHLRFRRLLRASTGPLRSLDVHASSHPYSGAHVAWIDVRFCRDAVRAREQHGDAVLDPLIRHAAVALRPVWAHVHDRDDDAIQNCDSPGMLRLGYGIDVPAVDLAANPGREWSRGELRFAANWRTWYEDEVAERLRSFGDEAVIESGERVGAGRLWSLPGAAWEPVDRAAQGRLRDGLGLARAAERDRWTLGYWQRKG